MFSMSWSRNSPGPKWKWRVSPADELRRGVRELGCVGGFLNGTEGGSFLDDPRHTPIFEAATELGVPLYLHPTPPLRVVRDAYTAGLAAAAELSRVTNAEITVFEQTAGRLEGRGAGIVMQPEIDVVPVLEATGGAHAGGLECVLDRHRDAVQWTGYITTRQRGIGRIGGAACPLRSSVTTASSGGSRRSMRSR